MIVLLSVIYSHSFLNLHVFLSFNLYLDILNNVLVALFCVISMKKFEDSMGNKRIIITSLYYKSSDVI